MISSVITVLAMSAAGIVAAPAPASATVIPVTPEVVSSASSFSIPAVQNPNYTRNGTASLLKAYAKYNIKPTREMPAIAEQLSKRQNGVVTASPYQGAEYICPVNIGGQTFNLDFDTGSSDLWVMSSLESASSRAGHNYYTSSKSSTFKSLSGYTWSIQYADGSGASGSVGTDTVTIGKTVVKNQAVELAKQVSSQFTQDGSDGLVGFGFSNINTVQPKQQATFFTNAKSSLSSPILGAYLPNQANGAYDFGALDSTKYGGTPTYTSVDSSNGFWEFPSSSYKVGATTYGQTGYTGIADTGTTLILMSDSAVDQYYSSVSGASYDSSQGGYTFSCSATLPSLSLGIGSTSYATIPSSLLNFGSTGSANKCFGALQSVGSGTQNIYGDVFFNAYYGVFDMSASPRFGFAALK